MYTYVHTRPPSMCAAAPAFFSYSSALSGVVIFESIACVTEGPERLIHRLLKVPYTSSLRPHTLVA